MTTKLKKMLGDAGAGIDESHGTDTLRDVLTSMIVDLGALTTSLNQLLTDYNAETLADHTTSSAVAVTLTTETE